VVTTAGEPPRRDDEIRRVLVTGGCGFIGANLIRYLLDHTSWDLRVIDDLRSGQRSMVEGLAEVVVGDAGEERDLDGALSGVDGVIHLASETGVLPSVENPVRDFQGNATTTFRVLEGCRVRGVERVVFASSGAALGDAPPPLHEGLVPRPLSPYGAGKLVGEAYCQAYAGSFGMRTVALRFSNVYGPFSAHKANAIPSFIKRCLAGEPLDIYGDGLQSRDFIYVDDLCDGILRSLRAGVAGEVFQLATGVETSVVELAQLVKEVTASDSEIRFNPGRKGEVYKSRADISKVKRMLGFEPRVGLREGLERTAQWFRDGREGLGS
jgi:UDP-glucose 4-epimerase